jgi:hypothetical protein
MVDLIYLVVAILFFGLSFGLIHLSDRLLEK